MTRRTLFLCTIAAGILGAAEPKAKNVILFIGDAGGLPTLSAASLHGYNAPGKLYIQNMTNHALVDTSAADSWVTDSAAGMTAIITGQKTNNGVISQSASAVKGKEDGLPLQTLLEHAEARGLSTGILSNMNMADATPAACVAHVNDRKKAGEIFAQVVKPRFGDGVDVIIGAGKTAIYTATEQLGINLGSAFQERGYVLADSVEAIPADAKRVVALFDTSEFDPQAAVTKAINILSKNPKGFFLMVEWDLHTTQLKRGLDRAVALDNVIRSTAERMKKDTLIVFTADHSFDLRVRRGKRGEAILNTVAAGEEAKANVRVENGHTGEEVVAAAQGPGSDRLRGFVANTDLFRIMMNAYGWSEQPARVARTH